MLDPGPIPPEKRIASIFLLPDCDMSCRFCASELGFSTMGFHEARALLEGLESSGITSVVFGGGEPFLWPHDLPALAARAKELGFVVQVSTNGVELPDDLGQLPFDRYILPLESMDAAVHDRLRRHRSGHHARILRRVEEVTRAGRELTLSTVVTRENAAGLGAIGSWLARRRDEGAHVHAWHLYRFLPVGRGGRANEAELALEPDEFARACAAIDSELGFPIYRRPDMLRSKSVEYFWIEGGELHVGSRLEASA